MARKTDGGGGGGGVDIMKYRSAGSTMSRKLTMLFMKYSRSSRNWIRSTLSRSLPWLNAMKRYSEFDGFRILAI